MEGGPIMPKLLSKDLKKRFINLVSGGMLRF